MRTPLDAFHNALLNLQAQKGQVKAAQERKYNRRVAAAGEVGETVTYRPPTNLEAGDRAKRDGIFGAQGVIVMRHGNDFASLMTVEIDGREYLLRRDWLDAAPLHQEDVDAAIESIMRSLRDNE